MSHIILNLMDKIEDLTGVMFHEYDSELEIQCINALDGEIERTFIINTLSKIVDELKGDVK